MLLDQLCDMTPPFCNRLTPYASYATWARGRVFRSFRSADGYRIEIIGRG